MLVKNELKAIPVLPKPLGNFQNQIAPTAQIVSLPKSGEVLAVDYHTLTGVRARFFCDHDNFICYSPSEDHWYRGYPNSCGRYSSNEARIPETDEVCNRFLCQNNRSWKRGIEEVNAFISDKGYEKRQKANSSMYELMRKHMDMFPGCPKNIRKYCDDQVFQKWYMFFSKKDRKGNRECRCSHCGAKITTASGEIKSGQRGTCPKCHSHVTYRAMWFKSDVTDKADLCIAYKVDGQLLIRWTHILRSYTWPDFKKNYAFDDFAYSLYTVKNGQQRIYTYKWFQAPYAYGAEWHRLHLDYTCDSYSYIYTDNLRDVFGEQCYNVDLQAGLSGKRVRLRFVKLLDNLKSSRKAEYLFKLGLPMLAESAGSICGNPDGQGIFQREVGVSKQYLPMLREMNVDADELRAISYTKEWVTPQILQAYRDFGADLVVGMVDLVMRLGIPKTLRYLTKQRELHPKETASSLAIDFRDYLNMSDELHVDLSHKSVLFPQDIVEAHKTITGRYNTIKNEIILRRESAYNQEFHQKCTEHYEAMGITGGFTKGDYCIVLPQFRTDLVSEGQSLNHCVGGMQYAQNHMKGWKMIFFIRRADNPGKPFFTMELDTHKGTILQLYGFGDCSAPNDVREFAREFAKFTQKKKERISA